MQMDLNVHHSVALTPGLPIPGNQDLENEEFHDNQEIDFGIRTWEDRIT